MKHHQRGISFIGLVFVGGVVGISFILAAQITPTLIEYQAINKAVNKATEGNSVVEVRQIFDRAAAIDDIQSINGKDLIVTKEGDRPVVAFAYTREIHLAGPGYLLLKYEGRSKAPMGVSNK